MKLAIPRRTLQSRGLLHEPEAVLKRKVVALGRVSGWRMQWTHDSRRSPEGWPDLFMVRVYADGRGRAIAAELKAEDGRYRPGQAEWLADLQACGIETYTWRPSDWDSIVSLLTRSFR